MVSAISSQSQQSVVTDVNAQTVNTSAETLAAANSAGAQAAANVQNTNAQNSEVQNTAADLRVANQPLGLPSGEVADLIERELDTTKFIFDPVDHGDIKRIAGLLNGIATENPAGARETFDILAERGLIDQLSSELIDRTIIPGQGGLSVDDRRSLYVNLAKSLDGDQLSTFAQSLERADGGAADVERLTNAVIAHGGEATKIGYAQDLAKTANLTDTQTYNPQPGASVLNNGDADAKALARTLASIDSGEAREDILQTLIERDEGGPAGDRFANLDAVLKAGVDTTLEVRSGTRVLGETQTLTNILNTADATLDNSAADQQLRADLFAAGSRVLGDFGENNAREPLLGGLQGTSAGRDVVDAVGALIDNNATSVVSQLYAGRERYQADALSQFAESSFATGDVADTQRLARIYAEVSGGANQTEAQRIAYFEGTTAGPNGFTASNAALTGFVVGSYEAGSNGTRPDATTATAFAQALVSLTAAGDPTGGVASSAAVSLAPLTVEPISDALQRGQGFVDAIDGGAVPTTQDGILAVEDSARQNFRDGVAIGKGDR